MGRARLNAVSAALASVALASMLGGPCTCLPEPVAAAEHACCAPPLGYRAGESDCCGSFDATPELGAAPASQLGAAPARVISAAVTPLAASLLGRSEAAPVPAVSPPLTVRRL